MGSRNSTVVFSVPARTRVGKYELGATLGEGVFGKVKYARNTETGEGVALKILDKEKIIKHKMAQQIKREISIMKLVRHPNVVQLYEVLASKTKIYLVLEYVTGGELFNKILHQGRLSEKQAKSYFQQLMNAIDYCHSRGVCHRDLKTENILLSSKGCLKISDFGLSALPQQCREDGLLHTSCGTPNYVAPEVISNNGYEGAKADIWSCGVILYLLMAGYLPFDDPNLQSLYRKIRKAEFAFPSWFTLGARHLISRLLDPNPKTRIKISQLIDNVWFQENYRPPKFEQDEEFINLDDVDAAFNDSEHCIVTEKKKELKPVTMNAFELIATAEGLNLARLFENQPIKRETRFASIRPASEIVKTIEDIAKPLGFNVQKKNFKMKLQGENSGRKGHVSVATEVFEVAPSLFMVELQKDGGDTLEYQKFYKNFSHGLKDIIWKSEPEN